jgi:hypothetical protein
LFILLAPLYRLRVLSFAFKKQKYSPSIAVRASLDCGLLALRSERAVEAPKNDLYDIFVASRVLSSKQVRF